MQARSEKRKEFEPDVRIKLLEDDADTSEVRAIRIEQKLDTIRNWLVTGAITFAFSCVLLGVNIALSLK
jgi:hypothetical protein